MLHKWTFWWTNMRADGGHAVSNKFSKICWYFIIYLYMRWRPQVLLLWIFQIDVRKTIYSTYTLWKKKHVSRVKVAESIIWKSKENIHTDFSIKKCRYSSLIDGKPVAWWFVAPLTLRRGTWKRNNSMNDRHMREVEE